MCLSFGHNEVEKEEEGRKAKKKKAKKTKKKKKANKKKKRRRKKKKKKTLRDKEVLHLHFHPSAPLFSSFFCPFEYFA